MPDKLTDSEIVKALEDTLHRIKGAEYLIVPKEGVKNLCNGLQNALDLINHLQAEVENYKQVAEHQQSVTLDKSFEIKELKAEIERLNNCVKSEDEVREIAKRTMEPLVREITREQIDTAVKLAKAEAYKECIEKATSKILPMLTTATLEKKETICFCLDILDNLLKEIVGDNE